MAPRLELHTLAVGQGTCNLVCEYDEYNNLIYLALNDCGKELADSSLTSESIEEQILFIKELMELRAAFLAYQCGEYAMPIALYIDHVIISHRDADHISFFKKDVFFKDTIPAKPAMIAEGSEYVKLRLNYKSIGGEPGVFGLLWDNPNSPHEYRVTFLSPDNPINTITGCTFYSQMSAAGVLDNIEVIGVPSLLESQYGFSRSYWYPGDSPEEACEIYKSSLSLDYDGDAEGNNHWGALDCYRTKSNYGDTAELENQILVWAIDYDDVMVAYCEISINYNLQFTFWNTSDKHILHIASLVTFEYADCVDIPDGEFCLTWDYQDDYDDEIDISTVIEAVNDNVDNELAYTKLCPEILRNALLDRMNGCFELIQQAASALLAHKHICDDWTDMTSQPEDIVRFVFGEANAGNDIKSLLIGRTYIGGKKTAERELARQATIEIEQYSISTCQEFSNTEAHFVDSRVVFPTGLELFGWYKHELYLIQIPESYYYEGANPVSKDIYERRAVPRSQRGMNAVHLADENDRSIVSFYHYPGNEEVETHNLILPGDATHHTMHHYLAVYEAIGAASKAPSVLVAPHHGSYTTCKNRYRGNKKQYVMPLFLEASRPEIIIISAGHNSRYGHPHKGFIIPAYMIIPAVTGHDHGVVVNYSNKGKAVTLNDFLIGITDKWIFGTPYYEDGVFNYSNISTIGLGIHDIHYVQAITELPQAVCTIESILSNSESKVGIAGPEFGFLNEN